MKNLIDRFLEYTDENSKRGSLLRSSNITERAEPARKVAHYVSDRGHEVKIMKTKRPLNHTVRIGGPENPFLSDVSNRNKILSAFLGSHEAAIKTHIVLTGDSWSKK